jgi:PadR family transcriptional regulator, regulatory protein AphA
MALPERNGAAGVVSLTPTGRVILGMIAFGRHTGYDIKQLVDKSTRHFWAASYGQIYPELRRLEEQGLVRGRPEPSGARARTVYTLTAAGDRALNDWLTADAEPVFEMRNEGVLKMFFSDLAPDARIENIRAMRLVYERKLRELGALEAKRDEMPVGPRLSLEFGLVQMRTLIEWCEETDRRLSGDGAAPSATAAKATNETRSEE